LVAGHGHVYSFGCGFYGLFFWIVSIGVNLLKEHSDTVTKALLRYQRQ
jgi:hypothetical protein